MKIRCKWASSNPELATYHDEEWGVPILDDNMLFEHLSLGGAQAGLSWLTILKRGEGYRRAFAFFDAEIVSRYSEKKIEQLLLDPGIIRNRLKVQSVVHNADQIKEIVKEYGSLEKYLWQFTRGTPKSRKMGLSIFGVFRDFHLLFKSRILERRALNLSYFSYFS